MIYRPEHPKPQFRRENWENLNGEWEFEQDLSNSGEARGLFLPEARFGEKIMLPFCPQSRLSGIGNKDFLASVWYRRRVTLSEKELSGRAVLHIGACDYQTTLYVNGQKVGTHRGGYLSFSFDITSFVKAGENQIVIHAEDDERDPLIPSGKQSDRFDSYSCFYTRTTGIWQTVWLEFTPKSYLAGLRLFPSPENASVTLIAELVGAGELRAEAFFEGKPMGLASAKTNGGQLTLVIPLAEAHLWELGVGNLYDLSLTFGEDHVDSYFGLRSIAFHDKKFYLNGKSVFQRLILDQGFYPDGIYTAPSDEALAADIDRALSMGFNGARLHQKIFEERFLYHADRKGYLVWAEYPSWGLDHSRFESLFAILPEWLGEIGRDFNHPSIVCWCPFNETWGVNGRPQRPEVIESIYRVTKAADPTRPCVEVSGNYHLSGVGDFYDVHDYNQNPAEFASHFAGLSEKGTYFEENIGCRGCQSYDNVRPFCISEYGGIRWSDDRAGWGYGEGPQTKEEFMARFRGLTDAILDNPAVFGFCYTQLTDVEQEQNGLYTYDRKEKFPPSEIAPIVRRKAAVEEE